MVIVDHVKTDLKCLDEYDSLLSHCTHKFMLSATYPNREGAYLYYDTNLGEFIRSGKVSGRGFEKRHASTKPNQIWQMQAVTFIFCIHRSISNSKIQDEGKEHLKFLKCILLQDLTLLQMLL